MEWRKVAKIGQGGEMKYIYPTLNYKEHRRCPNCPRLMIKRVSTEIDASIDMEPAKSWQWWCNCGETMTGGMVRGIKETTWARREWERVNNIQRLPESNVIDNGTFFDKKKAEKFLRRNKLRY